MPFVKLNIDEIVEQEKEKDLEFAREWDESRNEYKWIAELIKLRKAQNITQSELAKLTGNKQQVISRIEKRGNSPTLKTFCTLFNTRGYNLQIVINKAQG